MSKELLSRTSENTLRITAEFFEDGYVLKTGRSRIHRYDLDLYVRSDITLDQLLGAIFCGIRDVLQKRYKLNLKDNLAGIVYQDLQDPFAFRAADTQRGSRRLRPEREENIRMRLEAMRYRHQRRKLADMNDRYHMLPDDRSDLSQEQQERLGWIVCWQVFHECYQAYAGGYPDEQGRANAAQVRSQAYLMHPVIARSAVDLQADDDGIYYGAARRPQLQLIRSRDGGKTLGELGFLSSTRLIFDPVLWHHSAALYDTRALDPAISERLPYFDCSRPNVWEPDTTAVSIRPVKPPPMKPDLRSTPILLMIPLVMLLSALLTICFDSGIEIASLLPIMIIMLAATLLMALACWGLYWFGHRWIIKHWLRPYEREIRKTLHEINRRQEQDRAMMHQDHPPVYAPDGHTDLIHRILKFDSSLYGAAPGDWDYLHVRLGVSAEGSQLVPSAFRVEGLNEDGPFSEIGYRNLRSGDPDAFELTWDSHNKNKRKAGCDSGMLTELPGDIAREYGYLTGAPVLLDLKNAGAVGVVFQDRTRSFTPLLQNIILDLCSRHAPEHLQIAALYPREQGWKARNDLIRTYKSLPHFDSLLMDRSAFAFSQSEATALFDQLYSILTSRRHTAHIIVLVMEEYGLRDHPLAAYLPDGQDQPRTDRGITFIFCKHSHRELPPGCSRMLLVDTRNNWFLLPGSHCDQDHGDYTDQAAWRRYVLKPDTLIQADKLPDQKSIENLLLRAFKTVSAVRHRRDACNRLPVSLDLFSMMTYPEKLDACTARTQNEQQDYLNGLREMIREAVMDNWNQALSDSLETPIGCGETDLVTLDLLEGRDGPNLLIAGDRDTGKTMAALTLFYAMSLLYGPKTVAFVPVDLCNRGLAKELHNLPHTIQDRILQGGERMDVLQYMQRLLTWLEDEILRRKQQLSRFPIIGREDRSRSSMQHLFVIMDDYEMLARMTADHLDLSETILDLIRSAEGLGIHFVLISSGSDEAITDQLLDALSARICLRLADADAAIRICGSEMPAQMVMAGKGRAFRLGCTGSTAECFQLGYGNVDAAGLAYTPFQVVLAPAGGQNRCFFDSRDYIPDDPQNVYSWVKAVFEPLRIHYQDKQDSPKSTPQWNPGPQMINGDEFWSDAHSTERPDASGDQRWGGSSPENQNSRVGDLRWSGSATENLSGNAGDQRWDNAPSRPDTVHEGDRRWEQKYSSSWHEHPSQAAASSRWENFSEEGAASPSEKEIRPHRDELPGDDIQWEARWRNRYLRQWKGYPYNYTPPDYTEAASDEDPRWVLPDEALQNPSSFGITQLQFAAAVMKETASNTP